MEAGMVNDKQACADRIFLALTLWREARGESRQCKLAVAYSVLNRVSRPCWWGRSVCEVLFRKWQYSSMTDPHDPQLTTWPAPTDATWRECLDVAWAAIDGAEPNPLPGADSYHDTSIAPPSWAASCRYCGQIDRIKFYDADHDYEAAPKGA